MPTSNIGAFDNQQFKDAGGRSIGGDGKTKYHSDRWSAALSRFVSTYQQLLTRYAMRRGLDEHSAADVFQAILCDFLEATRYFRFDRATNRYYEKAVIAPAQPAPAEPEQDASEEPDDKLSIRFQRRIREEMHKIIALPDAPPEAEADSEETSPVEAPSEEEVRQRPRLSHLLFDMAREYARRIRRRGQRTVPLESPGNDEDDGGKVEPSGIEPPPDELVAEEDGQQRRQQIKAEALRHLRARAKKPNQLLDLDLWEARSRLGVFREKANPSANDPLENPMLPLIQRFNQSRKEPGAALPAESSPEASPPLEDGAKITRGAFDTAMSRIDQKLKKLAQQFAQGTFLGPDAEE